MINDQISPAAGQAPRSFIIPGVDVDKGIAMTGGTADRYRQVLSMFCKDVEARLQMLRYYLFESMSSGNNMLPEKHISLFTTQVHAIKSASATIGAAELSAESTALETAAFAKELTFIHDNLPDFVEHLQELINHIRVSIDFKQEQSPETDLSEYHIIFNELTEAIKNKDIAGIDRIIEELNNKPIDTKTRDTLELISDQVLMTEFDSAIKTIEGLIHSIK